MPPLPTIAAIVSPVLALGVHALLLRRAPRAAGAIAGVIVLAVYFAVGYVATAAMEASAGPEPVWPAEVDALYRAGAISYDAYRELHAAATWRALLPFVLGFAAAALLSVVARSVIRARTAAAARAAAPRDPPQLVGRTCARCGRTIVAALDAAVAPETDRPVHRACLDRPAAAE